MTQIENITKLHNHNMKKAFTLLELLVVIGIIAILVGLGTVSYGTAQKKARDARRQGDLANFQKAIEQCYSVNSYTYPTITGTGTATISYTCPAASGGPSLSITSPTTGTVFTVSSATSSYTVSIPLEGGGTYSIANQQ